MQLLKQSINVDKKGPVKQAYCVQLEPDNKTGGIQNAFYQM